ncbi:RloB family protein [Streptomyces sp. NPDC047097]|uniref:RloB family protein n=1 Tax=Streptomyces sp. NPDC047097 TaxID=3155260 RepID=UPI0034077D22
MEVRGRRSTSLGRTKGSRQEQRRYLVYCEGECTEVHYFKGLKQELRAFPVEVQIGGNHGEPKSLVRAAIAHKDRAPNSAADRRTPYDEVWCVIDVEAPRAHPGLDEALQLARRHDVSVALTNPCFELWVLLHFREVTRHTTSAEAQRLLEQTADCGFTVKKKYLTYASLDGRHDSARARAERLRAVAEKRGSGRTSNPWTDVDVLVDALRTARY